MNVMENMVGCWSKDHRGAVEYIGTYLGSRAGRTTGEWRQMYHTSNNIEFSRAFALRMGPDTFSRDDSLAARGAP